MICVGEMTVTLFGGEGGQGLEELRVALVLPRVRLREGLFGGGYLGRQVAHDRGGRRARIRTRSR
jgi:hypothetical protein